MKISSKKGFTLIELMVVMAIIAVLSTLIIAAITIARRSANDTRRREDLKTIQAALIAYESNRKNWLTSEGPSVQCGLNGTGNGFINYPYTFSGPLSPKSISQRLVDLGYLKENVIDPSGDLQSNSTSGNAYMKWTCVEDGNTVTYLYAKLETKKVDTVSTDGTCCPNCDELRGMNYYIKVQ